MAEVAPVLTLADLAIWSRGGHALAVLGHPIKHSISPAMHNAALTELKRTEPRFADWVYHRFDIHPNDLPDALERLHEKRFLGVNLTVPHKVIAFGRVAEIDEAARPAGAVNTLLWTERGWRGFNTDGYGLTSAVRETLGRDLAGAHIVLLGAGGAARGAAVECLQRDCAALWIANRTPQNLAALLEILAPLAAAANIPLRSFSADSPPLALPAGALVINATSAGLRASDPPPIDLTTWPRRVDVFDMIYNPPQTPLLSAASSLGLANANGLSMLVHQGARALEIWSGIPAARTAPTMAAAARATMSP